jgi:hypothetical protein
MNIYIFHRQSGEINRGAKGILLALSVSGLDGQ